ncbi:MAG: hypothetical protein CM1200mP2_59740 [Planctomycetaceae bacterium]|nr:MAG: hypothetical protein CM1200mP2_59740 [Planctomycetaceae bacterium]
MQAAATANRFLLLSESYQQPDLSPFQDSIVGVAFSDQADQPQGGRRLIVFDSKVEQFGGEIRGFPTQESGRSPGRGRPGWGERPPLRDEILLPVDRKRFVGVNAGSRTRASDGWSSSRAMSFSAAERLRANNWSRNPGGAYSWFVGFFKRRVEFTTGGIELVELQEGDTPEVVNVAGSVESGQGGPVLLSHRNAGGDPGPVEVAAGVRRVRTRKEWSTRSQPADHSEPPPVTSLPSIVEIAWYRDWSIDSLMKRPNRRRAGNGCHRRVGLEGVQRTFVGRAFELGGERVHWE